MTKHVTLTELIVVIICLLLKGTIFVVIKNGVYSWFSEGKEFLMACIAQDATTFRTPFPN